MSSYDTTQESRGRSRSRSRSNSRSTRRRTSSRSMVAMRPSRALRQFRPNGIKDFVFTYQPFNLVIAHGTNGGINFYNQGAVNPSAPAFARASAGLSFSFNYSLSGMATLINGSTAGCQNAGGAGAPNSAEYTALFDSYRIAGIEMKMVYSGNSVTANQINNALPNIMMANDYDDSNLTQTAALSQYDSMRVMQFGSAQSHTWKVRPRLQASVETTGGSILALTPPRGAWLDTAAPDVKYFGVKGIADIQTDLSTGTLTPMGFITFYVKAKLQFKNTR